MQGSKGANNCQQHSINGAGLTFLVFFPSYLLSMLSDTGSLTGV